jgi:hypothetical protein
VESVRVDCAQFVPPLQLAVKNGPPYGLFAEVGQLSHLTACALMTEKENYVSQVEVDKSRRRHVKFLILDSASPQFQIPFPTNFGPFLLEMKCPVPAWRYSIHNLHWKQPARPNGTSE